MKRINLKRNILMLFMVSIVLLSSLPVLAEDFSGTRIITPFDMDVSSGSYYGTSFSTSYSLKKSNGENINFWIDNKGNTSVVITINGEQARTIRPGQNGHITAKAGFFSKTYTFKAVPTPSGGNIDIDYRIAQRDY